MSKNFQNYLDYCLISPALETLEPSSESLLAKSSDPLPSVSSLEEESAHQSDQEYSISVSNSEAKTTKIYSITSYENLSSTSRYITFFEARSDSASSHVRSNEERITSSMTNEETFFNCL